MARMRIVWLFLLSLSMISCTSGMFGEISHEQNDNSRKNNPDLIFSKEKLANRSLQVEGKGILKHPLAGTEIKVAASAIAPDGKLYVLESGAEDNLYETIDGELRLLLTLHSNAPLNSKSFYSHSPQRMVVNKAGTKLYIVTRASSTFGFLVIDLNAEEKVVEFNSMEMEIEQAIPFSIAQVDPIVAQEEDGKDIISMGVSASTSTSSASTSSASTPPAQILQIRQEGTSFSFQVSAVDPNVTKIISLHANTDSYLMAEVKTETSERVVKIDSLTRTIQLDLGENAFLSGTADHKRKTLFNGVKFTSFKGTIASEILYETFPASGITRSLKLPAPKLAGHLLGLNGSSEFEQFVLARTSELGTYGALLWLISGESITHFDFQDASPSQFPDWDSSRFLHSNPSSLPHAPNLDSSATMIPDTPRWIIFRANGTWEGYLVKITARKI